ncbi:MAG: hypothetical protein PVI86_05735 [Phycisphaerae bacterium]|jgi:hypothetical protein
MAKRDSQAEEIYEVMLETARAQVAALNAGVAFWRGWVDSTAAYTKAATKELATAAERDANLGKAVSRLTDSSRKYLRELTDLPNLAVSEFNADIMVGKRSPGKRPKRAARAKG